MDLNSFLFPAPQSSYTIHATIGDLLFIPRGGKSGRVNDVTPVFNFKDPPPPFSEEILL